MLLTKEAQESLNESNKTPPTCDTCKKPIWKGYCGRCDLVTYTCACPFVPDPDDSWHIDHEKH